MFLSTIVPLTGLNDVSQPAFYGREAHALFLDLIAQADARLAEWLHSDQQRKPFTVSALRCADEHGAVSSTITRGQRYQLRFTALSERLTTALRDTVWPQLPPTIRLGEAQFATGQPVCEAAGDAWAGQASADMLMSKWFGADASLTNQIELEFVSPTAFKRQGFMFVVPLPALVFQSYLSAWNEFASPAFDSKILAAIESELQISRYHLRTRAVQRRAEGGTPKAETVQIGFVGRCAFTCFRPERALWRTLHLLADFAFYCGTGYKTTQGMGQTRRVGERVTLLKKGLGMTR